MKKIIITGGAGFVGQALARQLSSDPEQEILLIDNLSRGRDDAEFRELIAGANVSFRNADLTDAGAVAQLPTDCDYVYHLAALIGVKHVTKRPDQVLRVNLQSCLNLFEHFRSCGNLKRVLFSSTSEVYAGTLKHFGIPIPTAETTPLTIDELSNPRTSYALSKIAGEAIGLQYGQVHGIPVTNVRYHNVYGPRMGFAHVIPETILKISASTRVAVPSPSHTRAFCYIDDAVAATIACAESTKTIHTVVNIGNPDAEVSIRTLVETVASVMGREIRIEEMPDTPGSPARRSPEIARLTGLAGYVPKVSLRRGLEMTYEWYRTRLDQIFE